MNTFSVLDSVIFIVYVLLIVVIGLWCSRTRKGGIKDSKEYFLAGNTLPWWAIGASVIASNISAEQFIGMSGSGFAIGLGIASYEFVAAASLIVVAVFFLPIFLKTKIYTMPQFLEIRYGKPVKTLMAFFWLLVFIFVNLTSSFIWEPWPFIKWSTYRSDSVLSVWLSLPEPMPSMED